MMQITLGLLFVLALIAGLAWSLSRLRGSHGRLRRGFVPVSRFGQIVLVVHRRGLAARTGRLEAAE